MESPPISVTLADTKGHYGTPFKKKRETTVDPFIGERKDKEKTPTRTTTISFEKLQPTGPLRSIPPKTGQTVSTSN